MTNTEQFQLETTLVDWIVNSYDTVKNLKNKIAFIGNHESFEDESDFWTIGPKKGQPGKYFAYWHNRTNGSSEQEVLSITIIRPYLMLFCTDMMWHKFNLNKSAYNWARKLDLFLHDAYTDIPPLSTQDIINYIEE